MKTKRNVSDHNQSFMELVSTDWKPMLQIVFAKERGKDRRDNLEINVDNFISIKGIKHLKSTYNL